MAIDGGMTAGKRLAGNKKKLPISRFISLSRVGAFLFKIVRAVIIVGLCFVIVFPFFVKIANAFKSIEDIIDPMVRFIPKNFSTSNVMTIIKNMDYVKSVGVTSAVSLLSGTLQMFVCALIAYGFARFKFFGNKILFGVVILTLIVPPQTIIIPMFMKFRFFMFGTANLIDSLWYTIITSATGLGIKNGLYIFMLRQHFRNLPKELEEAAAIDGCGSFGTFLRVILPTSVTLLVTVFLLAFSWQWTDTVFTSLYLKSFPMLSNMMTTVPLVASPTMQNNINNAAALLAVLPLAVVYLFGQNFFIQGVERSGIVG